jgi:hypothetical protein
MDGEVIEESFDLTLGQTARVLEVMKAQEASDPIEVAAFGLIGVVFAAQGR